MYCELVLSEECKEGVCSLLRVHWKGRWREGRGRISSCCLFQLKSAVMAVEGDTAVVIANGLKQGETILDIVKGKPVGTLITRNGHMEIDTTTERLADNGKLISQSNLIRELLNCWNH